MGMERGELRGRALAEIERVRWIPGWGRERIGNMIATRPDWCISRQRDWGVPVVAVYCEACGEAIASEALCAHVAAVFEREGADAWFRRPVGELVPPGMSCPRCGGAAFRPETDILDVWFDSGVSWKAVVERRPELGGRADLYLEGSDQHRGWFHSALLTGVAVASRAPYDIVITHGFFVDGGGRKMSKSLGNVIAPEELLKRHGAELLRLRVAATPGLHAILDLLVRLMAPVLSFTAEDVWRCVPGAGRPESVFLAGLGPPPAAWRVPEVAARFQRLLTVRGAVSKAIEEARQAGLVRQSSEARVALATASADGLGRLLAERADELPSLLVVADVALGGADGAPESPLVPGLRVRVERAPGEKCPRCWNIRALGQDPRHPDLCERCAGVVA